MGIKCPKYQWENPDTLKFCGECKTQLIPKEEIPVTQTLETPTEDLIRGTIFASSYGIIEELGKGGMGRVYRVFDKKIEEEVHMSSIHATKPNLFRRIFQGGVDDLAAQTVPAELDPFTGFGSEFWRQ